jgi:peptide/nickel transport system ATP-binding protein
VPESKSDQTLLKVSGLTTSIASDEQMYRVVEDVSFELKRGQTLALLGESGCGKSMTALSIMGLLPKPAGQVIAGRVELDGNDLLHYSEKQMRSVRGKRIGMIFQEPMTSLNPVLTVGEQITEVLQLHLKLSIQQARSRAIDLLESVRIPDAAHRIDNYPHQLSGGMKQRIMIALALAAEPEILIADEPTTALDVTTQAQVLELIKSLQQKKNMAILLITHDLGIVSQMADQVAVMYAGELVELSGRQAFFDAPKHPYSRALFKALPDMQKRGQELSTIKGQVPRLNQSFKGCRYLNRCEQAITECSNGKIPFNGVDGNYVRCINYHQVAQEEGVIAFQQDENNSRILLDIRQLKVHFPIRKGLFKSTVGYVYAVDGVNLKIEKSQTTALVGESGCGKTTVGKSILRLIDASDGSVNYEGQDLLGLSRSQMKSWRQKLQFIFQDPFSSMNPRMLVQDILTEGLKAQHIAKDQRELRCVELLKLVGMDESARFRYPHEFSGGQRQRISIARAIAVNPEFIVCDEPTSALDVSVQAQILNLLRELQQRLGLSYLFITHNISVVSYLAKTVAVMYLGRIVESGSVEQILHHPKHPYTEALLAAVPELEKDQQREIILEGELPSAINPPQGCYFHPRCPKVMPQCRTEYPVVSEEAGHQVSCFLYP